ncbi:MAG TPA: ATP-binding protein [Gammaproteobacteria bacterium]|jgi:signal transduction histidine kinase|nr:ATP-binding protein [Gammaproteobacteria bacterium]
MSEHAQLRQLVIPAPGIPPHLLVSQVAEMFMDESHGKLLSLPVIDGDRPVGVVSRARMQQVLFRQYGRELFGRKPVAEIMNAAPVVIESDTALNEASKAVTERLKFPVTEDFIITEGGRYVGMGAVMHLLNAMEAQLAKQTKDLAAAYKELKASQLQLIQSEKMASLGQMVAGVAHEINTPLGYVKNNIEMMEMFFETSRELLGACNALADTLLSETATEQQLQEQLAVLTALRIGQSGEHEDVVKLFGDTRFGVDQISELVKNLKDFSRLDRAAADDVDLNECLDSAVLLARNVLKARVEVLRQYGALPRISCMPSQLNQVFLNLITNAAQAIEGTGRILIKTEAEPECLKVTVQDTGKGIPEDVLPRIFDPFFTTKPVGQGTGLGLSITYQIIQQHGGDIRVTSQPGKGSRFTIRLPLAGKTLPPAGGPQGETP